MKTLRLPLLLFALPALLIAARPEFAHILVCRRDALAQGEFWRLWSGHWVHFSPSHLGWNLAVVLVAGTGLEGVRRNGLLRFTLLAPPLLSLLLCWLDPRMHTYGGLSGLATGVVVLLGLQLRSTCTDPWLGFALLLLVAVKLGYEAVPSMSLFVEFSSPGVHSAPLAHAGGAALALLHHFGLRFIPLRKSSSLAPARPSSAAHVR